jgi:hypothetical protein
MAKAERGVLLVIGYLLSPLCWWNDLIFNLPVAYAFGSLCYLINPNLLMPGAIAGYWLSNIAGILLMQAGAIEVLQGQARDRLDTTALGRTLSQRHSSGVDASHLLG